MAARIATMIGEDPVPYQREAELIREGVASVIRARLAPAPRIPLFDSGDPTLAERVDEVLAEGFGAD